MTADSYLPLVEVSRGETVESIHYGAIAIADKNGELFASFGDPNKVSFLRSTAKPFQALPFIESEGHIKFNFTEKEIALICASHSGTDAHFEAVKGIQAKVGLTESDLACGSHRPYHVPTGDQLILRNEKPSPNRHNCSGKHTGMLAYAVHKNFPTEEYLKNGRPVQDAILKCFSEFSRVPIEKIGLGIDGCSAPNFAVPLFNGACAWASLADPSELSSERQVACKTITKAMMAHAFMVAGPDRFDTALMEAGNGLIVAKGGAEGYQGIGLLPGALGEGSPGLGITIKVSDGDILNRARPIVTLEVLRQLGAISASALEELKNFGPEKDVLNWRKLVVGQMRPSLKLKFA